MKLEALMESERAYTQAIEALAEIIVANAMEDQDEPLEDMDDQQLLSDAEKYANDCEIDLQSAIKNHVEQALKYR